MKFKEFAEFLSRVESEASRNGKTTILAELLKSLSPDEIAEAIYLMDARVTPRYVPLEFNFSEKLVIKSLSKTFDQEEVVKISNSRGDVGTTAMELKKDQKSGGKLELTEVFAKLYSIATQSGKNSQENKMRIYMDLFNDTSPTEIKYITRIVCGKNRLGMNDKTVLDAISWGLVGDKSLREEIQRAYGVRSDLGVIAELAFDKGVDALENINIEPGIPVASKLVEREKDGEEVFRRLGECLIQPKFDGVRAQIHFKKTGITMFVKDQNDQFNLTSQNIHTTSIYSRNMESITEMFPDIVQSMEDSGLDSFVIDSEVIGYDDDQDAPLPFQDTISRKRKYGVDEFMKNVPIKVFAFDCLYINGKDITGKLLLDRLKDLDFILEKLNKKSGRKIFTKANSDIAKTPDQLNAIFENYINQGLEGIIAKGLETIYKPGTRDYDWIKLKASSKSDFVDTVDAVVIGYYLGKGVRSKFGIGGLLLGAYDDKKDKFLSLAKVGTGIKDADWKIIMDRITPLAMNQKPENVEVEKILEPDVWIDPVVVCEIEGDAITLSKTHLAGRGLLDQDRGFSIRFPRLKKFDRDKTAQQATTVNEIKKMFELRNKK